MLVRPDKLPDRTSEPGESRVALGGRKGCETCFAPPTFYLHSAQLPQPDVLPEVEKGGHFAASEQPQLFTEELRAAFRSLR